MDIVEITMPKLGESLTEGTINKWLVSVGDTVKRYDPIVDVMTEKVNAEVPSSYAGEIKEIIAKEGETIAVGEPICLMVIETKAESEKAANKTDGATVSREKSIDDIATKQSQHQEGEQEAMRARFSPAVARLASEHNLQLSAIKGTGLGGRITRKDVEHYIAHKIHSTETKEPGHREQKPQPHVTEGIVELTPVRRAIADKMLLSKKEIPHAWLKVEADVSDVVIYREKIKNEYQREHGHSITYFAFFVYAVSRALKDFPELNRTWQGDALIQHKDVHISIAVAKEKELFVPVIRHVGDKSISGIAKEIARLAKKTREGKLEPADVEGGTFTINNTGTFGSVASMGIINHPQVAILQVESIVKRPVIIDDMFAARDIVNLCLSLDHRALDGLICGRFLARIKEILESINKDTFVI